MSQQNQSLHNDPDSSEPKLLTPGNKLIKRKLCQLQNKAYFFEGQLNPLMNQNQKIKAQLTLLNKTVISSTDLLRSLLPIGSSESRKLKLELANIEQISEMIKQDWILMEDQISKKSFTISVLQNKITSNKEQHESQVFKLKREIEQTNFQKQYELKNMQEKMQTAQKALQQAMEKFKQQILSVKQSFRLRVQRADKLEREFEIFQKEVHNRYRDYERTVERMKDEASTTLIQFEQSKKNLREIYQKLMSEKIGQQAEGFELLMKMKEQQKDRLMLYYQQKQQEMQKYLNQKSETIEKLQQISIRLRDQMRLKEETLYTKNKELQKVYAQIFSKQRQITFLKQSNSTLQKKFSLVQEEFQQKIKIYQNQIQYAKLSLAKIQSELKQKIGSLEKAAIQLNQQLKEKTQKLKATEKSLVTAQRRFAIKLQQEQEKWEMQKFSLQEKNKELQSQIIAKSTQLQQKISSFLKQKQKFKTKLAEQQKEHEQKFSQLKNQHQKAIQTFKQSHEQQYAWMKKQNDRILAQERIKNNQQMQDMMLECQQKIRKNQEQFGYIKKNLQLQLDLKNQQLRQKDISIQSIQNKLLQSQNQIQQLRTEQMLQITKIRQQSKKMMDDFQKQKQDQKKKIQQEMVKQLMEFQIQMELKQAEYQTTLKKIQYQMMNEINMLKSSNALEELESKYLSQMEKLKHQHQQEINCMEEKQKESQQNLIDQQKRRIQELIQQYEEDMTRLAKKLQSDIEQLNSQLVFEQHDHQITKMTRQQKITYLSKKIHQLKADSQTKETKILELQLQIQKYKKEQERIKQIIEQRVSQRKKQIESQKIQFAKQCQLNIDKIKMQAHRKINEVERDRLQHTQNMYQKFNQLKEYHEQQTRRLENKYRELQKLFSERPSRAQDLSKIKQLIQMRDKMDLQMQTYHKKVEHANQIVKYLNLELQNYKDTYDMFGPNDQSLDKPINIQSMNQIPNRSIIKLRKISNRINTQGAIQGGKDIYSSGGKYETMSPKAIQRKYTNDSVEVKQFRLFSNMGHNESQTLIPPPDSPAQDARMANKQRKDEFDNRLKRGKSLDKSGQIVLNAQNFLNLIRNNTKNYSPNIKQYKSNERRAYRKSKPRRVNTLGLGNNEMYSIAGRKSYNQDALQ